MLLLGGLVVWFKIKERGISVFNSSKNIHVSSFLRQEQKVNPTLNLVDPEFNIFGEVPGVKLRNGSLVITLDRSDEQLPSYLPLIKKKDLFILALYMRLLNINFFTNQIIGEVYYKNYTKPKVLRWEHQKTRQIVNNVVTEVKVLIKKIRPASQKYFPALFFRCAECEFFRNGCQKRTQLKFQRVKQNREEDIVELHRNFLQIKSKIEKTSWEHWKNDIQDFARFISSSPTMQKVINKIYRHKRNYDIEEAIETSAIHGTGLYNEYMITRRSRKEEITFSYQLLMYLSIKANKKTMAKFFGSDDVRDQKVREFFDKVFRNLYFEINNYLVSLIPENVAQNNYITFNNSMINLANDEGLINASMNIGVEQDEEDDD
ncbi:hypothetical protein [Seinonella peptonophila]|nr:hypothetical protein [Seinonella peptonophila]